MHKNFTQFLTLYTLVFTKDGNKITKRFVKN